MFIAIDALATSSQLIAMLSDNFRRMSDNIHAEYSFGNAQLVMRVDRTASHIF
jgi:hypothetical protein